jgi:hypothetical protein
VPRGRSAMLADGWRITVTRVIPDATAIVLAENPYNDPPGPGNQFFMVKVTATYAGAGSDSLRGSYRFRLLGASAVVLSTFKNSCGVTPNGLTYTEVEVISGGTISGNLCWQVPGSDVARLVMFDADPVVKAQRVWFALGWPGPHSLRRLGKQRERFVGHIRPIPIDPAMSGAHIDNRWSKRAEAERIGLPSPVRARPRRRSLWLIRPISYSPAMAL